MAWEWRLLFITCLVLGCGCIGVGLRRALRRGSEATGHAEAHAQRAKIFEFEFEWTTTSQDIAILLTGVFLLFVAAGIVLTQRDDEQDPLQVAIVQSATTSTVLGVSHTVGDQGTGPVCSSYSENDELPLRLCNMGYAVEIVQERLNALGYPVDVDEHFGPGTESAVRSFQQANTLQVDGLVGPLTWQALTRGTLSAVDEDDNGVVEPDELGRT